MNAPRRPPDLAPVMREFPAEPVAWTELFGNDQPVELEIGPGKGLFLANAAVARPSRNFIGVEISRKYAGKAAERVARASLENVRVIAGDGREFLHRFVPPASLAAVHIYFPDPWWKKRHKKRRVFCEPFVEDAARALVPGGELHLATDVEEYFGVMRALMAARLDFDEQPPPPPSEPRHDLDYLTNFERKYRLEGRPVFRASYRHAARTEPEAETAAGRS